MLVAFQFPIADARGFSALPGLRLPLPDWPEPATGLAPQFVHRFGKAGERTDEPDEAWPDEIRFVLARRGLRFDRLETRHAGLPQRRFRPVCAFRRLFSDGQAVTRLEIGLAHGWRFPPLRHLGLEDILSIGRQLAEMPVLVPPLSGEAKAQPLLAQHRNLARLYAAASANRDAGDEERATGLKLVEAGDPFLLIEMEPEEADLVEDKVRHDGLTIVDPAAVNGARALSCRLQTSLGPVSTWILQKGEATAGQLRSLRLCLTRLHAEREVLDLVLKQIHRGRLLQPACEEATERLDDYFNQRIKIVRRDKWGGMKQSAILAAFDATEAVVRPARREQLISRYDNGRRQVWQKIAAFQEERRATRMVSVLNIGEGGIYVEKQVTVSGTGNIVNVAEYMSNVTNTVHNNLAKSGAGDEVKDLVQQLNQAIETIAPQVEPTELKKMGKNLEALSKEIASDEPERRWYEVSLEGLKEAAEAVGELAEPVVKIAAKLAALLLV